MAHLYDESTTKSNSAYYDIKIRGNVQKTVVQSSLDASTTLYVGNLPTTVKEEQLHELFSSTGPIERIVLGVDKETGEPCGFCFVEYVTRKDAEDCLKYVNGTQLIEGLKPIYVDWDVGYSEGRELKIKRGRQQRQNRGNPSVQYNMEYDDKKSQIRIEAKEVDRGQQQRYRNDQYNYNDRDYGYRRNNYNNYGNQQRQGGHLGKRGRSPQNYDDDRRENSPGPESQRKRTRIDEEQK
jgi:nuclear cap-binding protein subunit 2